MADKKISQLTSASTPLAGSEVLPIVQSGATVKVAVSNLTAGRTVSAAALEIPSSNGSCELGAPGSVNTPFIDFHSAGTSNDYDTRLLAYGGSASAGQGNIKFYGANFVLDTGNLVQGTAAKGFDFSANTPAAGKTSTLLNWYEEGTWTCTLKGSVSDPSTPVTKTGNYTRIGRIVQFHVAFVNVNTTGASGAITFTGLPFTSANVDNHMVTAGVFQGATFSNNVAAFVGGNSTTVQLKSLVSNASWTDITHNAGAGAYFWIAGVYFV